MGAVIRYHARTAVPTGGSATFSYTHDTGKDAKPSRIGLIATAIDSGTQTGSVRIYYGNSPGSLVEIGNGTFTANDPSVIVEPQFVIYPGQTIEVRFSGVTAGDQVSMFIGGH